MVGLVPLLLLAVRLVAAVVGADDLLRGTRALLSVLPTTNGARSAGVLGAS